MDLERNLNIARKSFDTYAGLIQEELDAKMNQVNNSKEPLTYGMLFTLSDEVQSLLLTLGYAQDVIKILKSNDKAEDVVRAIFSKEGTLTFADEKAISLLTEGAVKTS